MRLSKFVSSVGVASLVLYSFFPGVSFGQEDDERKQKVVICHATSSETNPYNREEVDVQGVLNGHSKHEGDIIPPFDYGNYESFEGQNWTDENEALWEDNCGDEDETNGDETRSLTVTKVVINDDDGESEVSDFTLKVGDKEVMSGETNEFELGMYTITESGPDGYEASFSGDCDSYGKIKIHKYSDMDLECTITNDDEDMDSEPSEDAILEIRKFICVPGTEIVDSMIPNDNGDFVMIDGCVLAEDDQAGQQIGGIFEVGKTENTGPYPINFEEIGVINSDGELILTKSEAGRFDIAEGDGDDNFGESPDGFIGIACNDDTGDHTDNYEIALLNLGETDYCNVFNEGEVLGEATGTLHIKKYVCDENTVFAENMTPDSSGVANIPEGCELATGGFDIGFVFEEGNTTGNPPYPTHDEFELLGTTNASGHLQVQVLSGGRHFLAEANAEGNFTETVDGLIGFACEDDGGSHTNNFEAVFVEEDGTEYCNVYNVGENEVPDDEDGMLHFIKVICPSYGDVDGNALADAFDDTNGNYVNFANYSESEPHFSGVYGFKPVNPDEIPDNCDGAAGWSFRLSTNQDQTENVQIIGLTDQEGMLTIDMDDLNEELEEALANGDRIWVSEVSQDEVASFAALRCFNDATHGDNLEFIELEAENMDDHIYCIAYNVDDENGGGDDNGTVVITKYVCEDGVVFDTAASSSARPNNSGSATIPEGCELANGFEFGYIHEPGKTDLSAPYPGLDDDTEFTQISGMTGDNGTGKLVLTNLPTGGRLDLAELDSEGDRISDEDVIAFMCNEDNGIQDNNYEVVFNADDKISYCNVYNSGEVQGVVDTKIHLIKVICDSQEDVDGVTGSTPISTAEIPENCDRASGWEFALSVDQEQTDPEIVGLTDGNGEFIVQISDLPEDLRDAVEAGDALWISEEAQDDIATFGDLRCYNDAANGDNLEFIELDPENMPEDVYCIAYNVDVDDVDRGGNVVITKYVCDEGVQFDTTAQSSAMPDNAGNATIPEGCELANGFEFGYIHEPGKNDASGPYPGLDDNTAFTPIAGETGDDGTGKLVLTNLPTGGRLDLAELTESGDEVSHEDVIAFMCNEDPGIQDNNYEVVFNADDKTSYCNVYNVEGGSGGNEDSTTIHLIKVICETQEDIDGVSGSTPINPNEIPENCDEAEGWNFLLSTDEEQDAPTSFGPTSADGRISIGLSQFSDEFETTLTTGGQIWISEESQDDVATFGDLRCHTDAANGDNLDFIQLDSQDLPENVYCIAYNLDVLDECPEETNLLINGSFESPEVDDENGWEVYASGTGGLGWTVAWAEADPGEFDGDTRPATANLELQNSDVGITSQSGLQHAELDADWEGPTGDTTGEPANVTISQQIDAVTGGEYTLTFWAAVRDGSGGSVDDLDVMWNGSDVTLITGSTSGIWTQYTATVTGADGMDTLSFTETGTGDALGILLDNVSLILVCEDDDGSNGGSNGGSSGGGGGGSSTRRISGVKYNDENGNGVQDSGEDGLSGWVIYIDENDNNVRDDDEPARTTDDDGEYRFSSLSNGNYTVREVNQDGWTQTEPGSGEGEEYSIEITSSDRIHDDMDFGNTGGSVLGDNISFPTSPNGGQVLGDSIDLGGGESLPVTGISGATISFVILLAIALGLVPFRFERKEKAS